MLFTQCNQVEVTTWIHRILQVVRKIDGNKETHLILTVRNHLVCVKSQAWATVDSEKSQLLTN